MGVETIPKFGARRGLIYLGRRRVWSYGSGGVGGSGKGVLATKSTRITGDTGNWLTPFRQAQGPESIDGQRREDAKNGNYVELKVSPNATLLRALVVETPANFRCDRVYLGRGLDFGSPGIKPVATGGGLASGPRLCLARFTDNS